MKSGFRVSCSGVQSGWDAEEEVWSGDDDTRVRCLPGCPRVGAWSSLGLTVMQWWACAGTARMAGHLLTQLAACQHQPGALEAFTLPTAPGDVGRWVGWAQANPSGVCLFAHRCPGCIRVRDVLPPPASLLWR